MRLEIREVMFKTAEGIAVGSVLMETLRPGLYVHIMATSSWAEILNNEESVSRNGMTHRLFCSGVMLFPDHYKMDEATRLHHFTSNMVSVLKQQGLRNINGVDLVFIPILYPVRSHYYVMVFNLNTGKIELLDNIKCDARFEDLYDNWPFVMRDTFAVYLQAVNHRAAAMIKVSKLVVIDMPWRTKHNFVDCGVFAMRHMETYMGGSMKKWEACFNLSKEFDEQGRYCKKQQMELDKLRRKYVAKILLSNINGAKGDVIHRALLFDALPLSEKVALYNDALDRIKIRLTEVD